MNMINLDTDTIREMKNYRLRVKFEESPYYIDAYSSLGKDCRITVRTMLLDAVEVYSYTVEDLEKHGASELIRRSISKFVETHERDLFTVIYNDDTASLPQGVHDIIHRFKLHYMISYTIHGRNCTVWTDLFECKKTYGYTVARSNRVITNAEIIEDSIRAFCEDNDDILGLVELRRNCFDKEINVMDNEKNVRDLMNALIDAYEKKEKECHDLYEKLSQKVSENETLKDENEILKNDIDERDEELRELLKKNESLCRKRRNEGVDMYRHLLAMCSVDNEKLKDEIQTRMNNEKLDAVRISDLEETVKMLRETVRRKDVTIDTLRSQVDHLQSQLDYDK